MAIRAAILDSYNYVINTIIVEYLEDYPGAILAETSGNIGDFWTGTEFIAWYDPAWPPHP